MGREDFDICSGEKFLLGRTFHISSIYLCYMFGIRSIRRSRQLAPLLREHRRARKFARSLKLGIINRTPAAEMVSYVRWYWNNFLQPHFDKEENIVLVNLHPSDEMAKWLRLEHENIKELITSSDLNRAMMTNLSEVIKNHVRFEERRFFPYVEKKLTKAQLNTILSQLKEHVRCNEKWPDKFWERKVPRRRPMATNN
jgi:hemerythrin-like domain-containing protein